MDSSLSSETTRPVSDLSARAVSLAREIDRLPPGAVYVIVIDKPDLRALDWTIEINRQEHIRDMILGRRLME